MIANDILTEKITVKIQCIILCQMLRQFIIIFARSNCVEAFAETMCGLRALWVIAITIDLKEQCAHTMSVNKYR